MGNIFVLAKLGPLKAVQQCMLRTRKVGADTYGNANKGRWIENDVVASLTARCVFIVLE